MRRSAELSASSPHLSRSIMPTKASHFQTFGSVGSGIRYGRIRGFKKSSRGLNQRLCTNKDRLDPRGFFEAADRSEEHTSELQSRGHLVCRHLLEKKNTYYF